MLRLPTAAVQAHLPDHQTKKLKRHQTPKCRLYLLHNVVLRLPTAAVQAHLTDHQTKYL
jgi:hypothetical protein